tara:strand:+ start:855 stop:1574 length:720 start_codon:yes stop_codon:yes gene_type:complete
VVAIGASKFLFKHDLPSENFVTMEIVATIDIPCQESDTGILYQICEEESIEIYSTRASGAAISRVNGLTYFLTAEHFCDTSDLPESVPADLIEFVNVQGWIFKDGKKYPFNVEKTDRASDLCLVSSDYPITEEIEIARKMPDIGERTVTISSPLGISESGVSLHFSGTFSGCNIHTCFFTIPTISGSSGSPILNHDKEIVSITQKSLIGFPDVAIGISVERIREFISEYEEEQDIDITP